MTKRPTLFYRVTASTDEEFEAQIEEVLRLLYPPPRASGSEAVDGTLETNAA